jgi:hypothetical protein
MHIAGQSTMVSNAPERLPDYWFESRRRYFALAFGVRRAMAIDIVAILAHALGSFKRLLQGRSGRPCFIRDLVRHSVLRAGNRTLPVLRSFVPPR